MNVELTSAVYPFPKEVVAIIASKVPTTKQTIYLLSGISRSVNNRFAATLAHVSAEKLGQIFSDLMNEATDGQWNSFFARLGTAKIPCPALHLVISKRPNFGPKLQGITQVLLPSSVKVVWQSSMALLEGELVELLSHCPELCALEANSLSRKLTPEKLFTIIFPKGFQQLILRDVAERIELERSCFFAQDELNINEDAVMQALAALHTMRIDSHATAS